QQPAAQGACRQQGAHIKILHRGGDFVLQAGAHFGGLAGMAFGQFDRSEQSLVQAGGNTFQEARGAEVAAGFTQVAEGRAPGGDGGGGIGDHRGPGAQGFGQEAGAVEQGDGDGGGQRDQAEAEQGTP